MDKKTSYVPFDFLPTSHLVRNNNDFVSSVEVVLETVSGTSNIDEEDNQGQGAGLGSSSENYHLECKKLEAIKFLAKQKVFLKVNPGVIPGSKTKI